MKMLKCLLLLPLTGLLLLSSCTSEFDSKALVGHWEISSAERDGERTETLTSTYFDFDQEGGIATNFNIEGTDFKGNYELVGNTIEQKGEIENSYTIDKLENNELVLRTTLMNYNFKLFLEKK